MTTTHAKANCLYLSMSTNSCSIISSSLEEEVKPIKLKQWLEVEVMILEGKYTSQMRNEKNNNVTGASIYIVLTYHQSLQV
jgi:hypothetical protein